MEKIATKHGVTQTEVREILMGVHKLKFIQKGHYSGEDMYAAIFFIYKKALVLSARDMSSAERKRYAKG